MNDSFQPLRCLVVDDDRIIQLVLSHFLNLEGHHVETASDGREGVEKAVCFQPHLIFMDIEMPHLGGIEAARRIREEADMQTQPVIVAFTSVPESIAAGPCLDAGMDEFVSKPFDREKIRNVVQRCSEFSAARC
jgi:CheY-like chemotaxis protein